MKIAMGQCLDRLELCGLEVMCVIGERPEERDMEQTLKVDVCLEYDMSRVVASDALCDAVDYAALAEKVRLVLRQAKCRMIECAAERVAEVCMAEPLVLAARVRVEKTGGVPGMRAAAVEIRRHREEAGS